MKCPYAVNRMEMSSAAFVYDAEGKETSQIVTSMNLASFTNCLQNECGAYDSTLKKCCFNK